MDGRSERRATLARHLSKLGVHTEIYASIYEFGSTASEMGQPRVLFPRSGIALVSDDDEKFASDAFAFMRENGCIVAPVAYTLEKPAIPRIAAAFRNGGIDYLSFPDDFDGLKARLQAQANVWAEHHEIRVAAIRGAEALKWLSNREREVINLVADGLTNREVGEKLGISSRTVEIHRASAVTKLGFGSSARAVSVIIQARLLNVAL